MNFHSTTDVNSKNYKPMKIAVPTADRINIYKRTGQTPLFAIVTINEANITKIEYRENPPHKHTEEEHNHAGLVELVADCDLILMRNVGKHLKAELDAAGMKIRMTSQQSIGEAIHQMLQA
jgi:predicted Fe-Mo cluster-binding NifX family protein